MDRGMATISQNAKSSPEQAEQKFLELLRGFDFAMLVSHANDEQLHARPMAVAETGPDGSVWFITGIDTAKTFEVAKRPEIIAVMQSSSKYLSVAGTAEISKDREHIQRIWKESYRVWFNGKDDPNMALIRLRPTAAEYWDNSGAQGVKFALRFAKAYVTGEQLRDDANDLKTHGKVQL
jgi:general stress protein 26